MLTFPQALTILNKRSERRLGNNTILRKLDDKTICVELHGSRVVTLHKNNTWTLDSCGYRTNTTKARFKSYSPAKVYQDKSEWFLTLPSGLAVPFVDGVTVNEAGEPI